MENVRCSFCYQFFIESDEICITKCGHRYHYFCICCCSNRSETCYRCKASVKPSEIHRVYFNSLDSQLKRNVPEIKNDEVLNKNDTVISCTEYDKNKLNLFCAICTEFFAQTGDVFVTICGHMFHGDCLCQWLSRSETCPQCRKKCSQNNMIKVYFNSAKLDTNEAVVELVQEQEKNLRKAEEEIKILNKNMKMISDQKQKLQDENNMMTNDVRNLRKEIKMLRFEKEKREMSCSIETPYKQFMD